MSTPTTPVAGPDEERPTDEDSAYGASEEEASTTSVTSSVMTPEAKHNRTYHSYHAGIYPYPNDKEEQDRLDLQHALLLECLNKELFLAPISHLPEKILDVGTGTGIWAINVADKYASCTVVGIDLSPIQPEWVPPNCQFQVSDANDPWSFPPNSFEFVHCRQSHMAVKEDLLFREAFRALKPGAWLEMGEMALPLVCEDGTLKRGMPLFEWQDKMMSASKKIGASFHNPHHYRNRMEDSGFVNVVERIYPLPIGPWAKNKKLKKLGQFQKTNLLMGLDGFSKVLFTEKLGLPTENVERFLDRVAADIVNPKIHAYVQYFVVYGQKPRGT